MHGCFDLKLIRIYLSPNVSNELPRLKTVLASKSMPKHYKYHCPSMHFHFPIEFVNHILAQPCYGWLILSNSIEIHIPFINYHWSFFWLFQVLIACSSSSQINLSSSAFIRTFSGVPLLLLPKRQCIPVESILSTIPCFTQFQHNQNIYIIFKKAVNYIHNLNMCLWWFYDGCPAENCRWQTAQFS